MIFASTFAQENTEASVSESEVTIGKQVWSAANLNVNTFKNGDKIMLAQTAEDWEKATRSKMPAYCYYSYQDEINELKSSKKSIQARANEIKESYKFQFDKIAELNTLQEQYDLAKDKASKSKNSKKELASVEEMYKPKLDAMYSLKAEHERASKEANEVEYRKALEGMEELDAEIALLESKESELGNGAKYGFMYNYWVLQDPRGLNIPEGWNVPSIDDVLELEKAVEKQFGAEVGLALRSSSDWFEIRSSKEFVCNGNNVTSFNGLPGGWRNQFSKKFDNIHDFSYWWTSTTVSSANSANAFGLDCMNRKLYKDTNSFGGGLYIRLIKSNVKKKK